MDNESDFLDHLKPIELHIKVSGQIVPPKDIEKINKYMYEKDYCVDSLIHDEKRYYAKYYAKDNNFDFFTFLASDLYYHFAIDEGEDNFYISEEDIEKKKEFFKESIGELLEYLEFKGLQRIGIAVRYFSEIDKIDKGISENSSEKKWHEICEKIEKRFLKGSFTSDDEKYSTLTISTQKRMSKDEKEKSTDYIKFEYGALTVISNKANKGFPKHIGFSILYDAYQIRQDENADLRHLRSITNKKIDTVFQEGKKHFEKFLKRSKAL